MRKGFDFLEVIFYDLCIYKKKFLIRQMLLRQKSTIDHQKLFLQNFENKLWTFIAEKFPVLCNNFSGSFFMVAPAPSFRQAKYALFLY